jgi:hypothetical protein
MKERGRERERERKRVEDERKKVPNNRCYAKLVPGSQI